MEIKLYFYQFHIGDYRAATAHLSNEEDICYRRLIDFYYDLEGPIPTDLQRVSRRIRVAQSVVSVVLNDFFVLQDNGWFHARCEQEIARYRKMSEGGKAGADKRWHKGGDRGAIGGLSVPLSPPNANQEPITNNHKPVKEEKTTRKQVALSSPDDISQEVWQDFLLARKAAKAPVTDRVIDSIRTEARSVGWSLEQAMREMVARGWRGFKGEWVSNKPKQSADIRAAAAETIFGKNTIGDRNVIDITPTTRYLGV